MTNLLELYTRLVGLVLFGFILGRKLPAVVPTRISQFIFWIGAPVSIMTFVQRVKLSNSIWIAPMVAYMAAFIGAVLALLVIKAKFCWQKISIEQSTQGSLILASMIGNTGFLGYPITLSVADPNYFAWALFYDLLGTLFATYGIGVVVASYFSVKHLRNVSSSSPTIHHRRNTNNYIQIIKTIIINPALWGFGFGSILRYYSIPQPFFKGLEVFAWGFLGLSLILIGMRLSKLNSWHSLPLVSITLIIKMLFVPLFLGLFLKNLSLDKSIIEVVVLQMAMPPAFATLVIAEIFDLDKDLSVTAIAIGSMTLLVTLPMWLWLF